MSNADALRLVLSIAFVALPSALTVVGLIAYALLRERRRPGPRRAGK